MIPTPGHNLFGLEEQLKICGEQANVLGRVGTRRDRQKLLSFSLPMTAALSTASALSIVDGMAQI